MYNIKIKKILYWFGAVLITLASVVYQRATGPTNPKKYSFNLAGKTYEVKLPRSLETEITPEQAKGDYEALGKISCFDVEVKGASDSMQMTVFFRRYPSQDTISIVKSERSGDIFTICIPSQPPAGKLEYFVEFSDRNDHITLGYGEYLTIRFKNLVPVWVLLPHVLLMFIAMLLSTYVGIIAFDKTQKTRVPVMLLMISLFLGGLLFGPIVQKYAFGEFWTGWPFGHDMTDNKTLAAMLVWMVAILGNRSKKKRWWYVVAAIFMLLIYSIPHSTSGSEFDYSKKEVVTGEGVNICEHPVNSDLRC